MDKQQFAETVADAVFNFSGMNQCWLVYDTENERFFYQSSLTPVFYYEIVVDYDCSADSFGVDLNDSTEEEFVAAIVEDDWLLDYWLDVQGKILYQGEL